jgi:hypothetical protein
MPDPIVGEPGNPLVVAANESLADPNVRETIRHMHEQQYPLVKMVEDLGLDDYMSPQIRHVLENLSPKVVDGIREATLEMLKRAEHEMPLDCNVTEGEVKHGARVHVEVREEDKKKTIHVRAAKTPR